MSNEQTSTESSNDDQTNEDSDVFRQVDDDKHEKFASFSDTTLQDIPTEILQYILVKAVAMEVKNMKLVKSVWKEKADLVISRLETVCSHWSNVFATDFFRLELHRTLDGIAQEKIRMEILSDSFINYFVNSVATLKDEILMFSGHYHEVSTTSDAPSSYSIIVYDRNNMKDVKEVIELPLIRKANMASCSVSNCVYVLDINDELHCSSILRIARDDEQKFNIQTWISNSRFPIYTTSFDPFCFVTSADTSGRILIHDFEKGIELLDSEFNHWSYADR